MRLIESQPLFSLTGLPIYSYFRPPKGAKAEVARKWTDKERELLIKGIEKHGIGHFREISEEFLPLWVTGSILFISGIYKCTDAVQQYMANTASV
jgi:hypothetical protein